MPASTVTPMSLFGKSPLEGKSWLRSSGGCLGRAGCGQESRGRHLNPCQAAAPLSTLDINKERREQEELSLSGHKELC